MTTRAQREALRAADARARRLAQEVFDRPLVLEAGAGTGKTATLIARIVVWSLGPGWEGARGELAKARADTAADRVAARVLQGVLAITFTEAAAAEMATRVGQALAAIEGGGSLPPGLAEELLPADAEERRRRARALLGSLDRLAVRTIHAFCLRLLATHPMEVGLPPSFDVDADGRGLSELTHELVERELTRPPDEGESPAVLALVARGVQPESIRAAVADLLDAGVPPEALDEDPLAPERLEPARRLIVSGLEEFRRLGGERLSGAKRAGPQTLAAVAGARAAEAALAEPVADPERFVERLRESAGPALARWKKWAAGKFNKGEAEVVGVDHAAIARSLVGPLRLARAALSLDPGLLQAARLALRPLLAEARERLTASGLVTYQDLLRLGRDLLRDRPAVAALERGRLRQVLVDEFQDTNRLQCALVELLALSGEPSGRPGLFLVGDPKQSIYGWRNADLAAYHEFVAGVAESGGEKHALTVNFRSVPAILDEVERVVAPVMHEELGLQPAFEPLVACPELQEEPGFRGSGRAPVEHWDARDWERSASGPAPVRRTLVGRAAETEAQAIARDVRRLHDGHGVPWTDFALLLRTTGEQETFLKALREAGVPFAVSNDKSYYRRREVIEASALVRCVLDPCDQLALVALLRSPLVGVPDAALIPLWARGLPRRVAGLARAEDERLPGLRETVAEAVAALPPSIPGLERVAGWERGLSWALASLGALRESLRRDPPDVFVERLSTIFLVEPLAAAGYLGAFRVANLERFLRELKEELCEPGASVARVLRRLRTSVADAVEAEEGRPREAAEDAVQVMTIHGAKGLDFGHVYVPRLDKQPPQRERAEVAAECVDGVWELRLFGSESLHFGDALARARRVAQAERVRLLYVAMTRARQRLVLMGMPAASGAAVEPLEAKSMAELMTARAGGWPDLDQLGARAGGDRASVAEADALFAFPALAPVSAQPGGAARASAPLPTGKAVGAAVERLEARRAEAAVRQQRPFAAAASTGAGAPPEDLPGGLAERFEEELERRLGIEESEHAEAPEGQAEPVRRSPRRAGSQGGAERARAVGNVVHRVLELLDTTGDEAESWSAALSAVPAHAAALASAADAAAVAREARAILQGLPGGRCLQLLRTLGEAVLARELPVLLPPDEIGPVGFVAGAIDLVYRDPADGAIVVADYKTDLVDSDAELAEQARRHGPQLAAYRRAVREAFGLERAPRAELWFLRRDAIVVLE